MQSRQTRRRTNKNKRTRSATRASHLVQKDAEQELQMAEGQEESSTGGDRRLPTQTDRAHAQARARQAQVHMKRDRWDPRRRTETQAEDFRLHRR